MENYIFDLYGTLIDVHTDEHSAQTWKKWLRFLDRKGIKHPDYIRFRKDFFELDSLHRLKLKEKLGCEWPEIDILEVYRELFAHYGNKPMSEELLNEVSYQFRVASRDYMRLFPGVREYLISLRAAGKRVYILSNAQRSYTWPEITFFELDKLTDDQLISSDFGVMKPEKAFFDALINKYNLDRAQTLMHGDSLFSDIGGAKAACINYVHLAGENRAERYYIEELNKSIIKA